TLRCLRAGRFRCRDADHLETGAHPFAEQIDEVPRGRTRAEAELHAVAHVLERAPGGLALQSFDVDGPAIARGHEPSFLDWFRSGYLASIVAQEQPEKRPNCQPFLGIGGACLGIGRACACASPALPIAVTYALRRPSCRVRSRWH